MIQFWLIIVLLVPAATVHAELVDRMVAAVNNEVITWSELQRTIALNKAVAGNAGDLKRIETETLEGLINKRLLLQEARRLRFAEVSEQDVAAEVDKLKKRFITDKALADFLSQQDMTREELSRMLGERLLAERFVEKKVGLFVRVGREEAEGYFKSHRELFPGKRFQEVQKRIMAMLTEQMIGQQIDQYVADLRAKAELRMNPPESK